MMVVLTYQKEMNNEVEKTLDGEIPPIRIQELFIICANTEYNKFQISISVIFKRLYSCFVQIIFFTSLWGKVICNITNSRNLY
jgi:hypothetical protein